MRNSTARIGLGLALLGATLAALTTGTSASAEGAGDEEKANIEDTQERCATRLSLTLLGELPSAELVAAANPLASVDSMVDDARFADRFASFINASFNGAPSEDATQEPVYFLAKHVIENDKPWKELFVGHVAFDAAGDEKSLTIGTDPDGLGYFREVGWMKRYAGNEEDGVRINSAFRILQNTTALQLNPSVGAPGEDRGATGRKAGGCKSCHYENWYALDKAAAVLSLKKVDGQGAVTFVSNPAGPQQLFGKTVKDDREMLEALVDSDAFRFGQCRYVFRFLFGRPETTCEAKLFDRCTAALAEDGSIKSAVSAIAKDPGFCQ